MGAVNTTYTFTATDTITSAKMNNIIDQTTVTDEAIIGTTLEVASGKLKVRSQGITSNEMAANSVTSTNIVDGTIVNDDISPTAAIAGSKINPNFVSQGVNAGSLSLNGSASSYTVATLNNTSGVQVQLNANGNTEGNVRTVTNHPLSLSTNNTERMRITAAGNVGIGTSSPSSKVHISGSGQTTANITDAGNQSSFLRVSDSSSATGSGGGIIFASQQSDDTGAVGMAAIKGLLIDGSNNTTGDLAFSTRNLTVDTSLTERMRITADGNVGIGKTPTTKLDVNGTVTATSFAGPLTGNVTGTATTATTVSNGAITAAKLNGAQGGSAPIYGIRAAVNFEGRATNGNCTIRSSNNVSSVSRVSQGKYVVNFAVPMQGTGYTVVASAGTSPGSPRFACADRSTAAQGSIKIETDNISGTVADFNENNVIVIE